MTEPTKEYLQDLLFKRKQRAQKNAGLIWELHLIEQTEKELNLKIE